MSRNSPTPPVAQNLSSEIQPIPLDNPQQLQAVIEKLRQGVREYIDTKCKDESYQVQERVQKELNRQLLNPLINILTENVSIDGHFNGNSNNNSDILNQEQGQETEPYDDLLNRNVIYQQEEVLTKVSVNCQKRSQVPMDILAKLTETLESSHSTLSEREQSLNQPYSVSLQKPPTIPERETAMQDLDVAMSSMETVSQSMPEYIERANRIHNVEANLVSLASTS